MAKLMKALVLSTHGDLANLELVTGYPIPQAVAGHAVIRVRASSFNYHDLFTVKGMPGIRVPLPVIIGLDMAGEITELGEGVGRWRIGDRVLVNPVNKKKGLMGEMLDGGMAEYMIAEEKDLVALPAQLSYADGAQVACGFGTVYEGLQKIGISGDHDVLITGLGPVGLATGALCRLAYLLKDAHCIIQK